MFQWEFNNLQLLDPKFKFPRFKFQVNQTISLDLTDHEIIFSVATNCIGLHSVTDVKLN